MIIVSIVLCVKFCCYDNESIEQDKEEKLNTENREKDIDLDNTNNNFKEFKEFSIEEGRNKNKLEDRNISVTDTNFTNKDEINLEMKEINLD